MTSSLAERWTLVDRCIQKQRFRKVRGMIPEGAVVADLGCGNGELLFLLRTKLERGYGLDAAIQQHKTEGNLQFIQGSVEARIPLADESVDVVTALAVIEHLVRPERFSEEVFRILRKGGQCMVTTPSVRARPVLEFLALKMGIISKNDILDHKRYYTKDDLEALFHKFSRVRTRHFQMGLNVFLHVVK